MAKDFSQGYPQRSTKGFQRKSQQLAEPEAEKEASSKLVWIVATFLSVGLLGGYIVVKHFATQGVGSRIEEQAKLANNVSQAAKPLTDTVQNIFQPLPEKPVKKVIEAINLASDETKDDGTSKGSNNGLENRGPQAQEMEYSFYQGLSETEVIVEAEPISVALANPHYILAGTFGSNAVAENEQRRLKKMGQEVELTVVKQQKTYYRLRVGPFYDRLKMNKKRNELRRLGVDTMVMKITRR